MSPFSLSSIAAKACCVIAIASAISACQTGSADVSVRIEPQTAQLAPLTTVDFNARVGGTFAESVVWSIEGGRTDAGTIDANGLYTAPVRIPRTNEIVVLATSTVDATKVARATVNILALPFTPTRGTTAGGTRVTLEGREFTASTQVLFGDAPGLDVVLESSTRLRVTTPAVSARWRQLNRYTISPITSVLTATVRAASSDSPRVIGHDEDGDGLPDFVDNCPHIANVTQANADADQAGDACDSFPTTQNSRNPTARDKYR